VVSEEERYLRSDKLSSVSGVAWPSDTGSGVLRRTAWLRHGGRADVGTLWRLQVGMLYNDFCGEWVGLPREHHSWPLGTLGMLPRKVRTPQGNGAG